MISGLIKNGSHNNKNDKSQIDYIWAIFMIDNK